MKRMVSIFMVLCLVMVCAPASFAAEYEQTKIEPVAAAELTEIQNSEISPFGYGGPAPQVTKIELVYAKEVATNPGNLTIRLKVTGYGNDRNKAFFDGVKVSGTQAGYFINYGTTADGFYYDYDCGPLPEAGTGSYRFTTTFKSINSPYSELSFYYDYRT